MNNLLRLIAKRLKSVRAEKTWSLDFASKKTGVSKAMLGQIEREESMPTIGVLWKIASGFNQSFSSFLSDETEYVKCIAFEKELHPADNDFKIKSMIPFNRELFFEAFLVEINSGCERISQPHQVGVVEHVIVVSGEIEVLSEGTWHKVGQYENFFFRADQTHGYRNSSSQIALFNNIIHYTEL